MVNPGAAAVLMEKGGSAGATLCKFREVFSFSRRSFILTIPVTDAPGEAPRAGGGYACAGVIKNETLDAKLCRNSKLHKLFSAEFCFGFFVILILGNFWFLAVLYLLWLYLDWGTPCAGGRRSHWVRSWTVWKYFREYFPIHLIKTSELNPNHNYLLGFHPHGVLVAGAFGNFCTDPPFKNLFPGLTPYLHIMPLWFGCPFFREYIMSAGMVSASKESVSHVLSNKGGGHASVIVIGGAEESLNAHPGSLTLNILKRKGFIKMALKHGAHLVPVFSFGENELFKQVANPKGSWLRNVQEKLQKKMGFALPLFHARGVFQYSFGLIPYRQPIHTVVGSPIPVKQNLNPTTEEIDQLHALYLQKLKKLFEEHKSNYGIPAHKSLIFE
ncbi:2-acylglycerol O-acyltransferase 1 isoform X2 [Pyrgilauda ruficollis]|uniref:2-acylglycerol O-acyltransferase 1 isoform X2 n=1 Tax=Pyrgilauda ruficollis TaxID=221976 RepID=UPI001B86E20C|nr:2-acylglycerol O-acyltransferase 1 isoform X2 [Pyrgilauda ruficollis]